MQYLIIFTVCYFAIFSIYVLFKDDVSYKKTAEQSHTYVGTTGTNHMYVASNAVDRDISTCMRTNDIGSSSVYKKVWWKVNLGGVFNIYSINIQFKNYAGFGMYYYDIFT